MPKAQKYQNCGLSAKIVRIGKIRQVPERGCLVESDSREDKQKRTIVTVQYCLREICHASFAEFGTKTYFATKSGAAASQAVLKTCVLSVKC